MTSLQRQNREDEALFARTERNGTVIDPGPYGPQQPQIHRHQRDPSSAGCPDYEPTMNDNVHAEIKARQEELRD